MWYSNGNCGTGCGTGARKAFRRFWADQETEHSIPLDVLKGPQGEYVIRASLPGFKKEDVSVSLEQSVLTIAAKRQDAGVGEGEPKYLLQERAQGDFARRVKLEKASDEGVKAELKDGVLTVIVQRKPEVERSIAID